MAKQVQTSAPGNEPATGMPHTPAPVKPARPIAPDLATNPRALTPQSYSQNGPHLNDSSIPPGTQRMSALAANMRATVDDPVLDIIQSRGLNTATDIAPNPQLNWQIEKVAAKNVKDAFGMESARARQPGADPFSGKVPQGKSHE